MINSIRGAYAFNKVTHGWIKGTLLLSASLSTLALAPVASAQDAGSDDEIVSTGIRQSMKAAADLKRNDSRIVDAIVAEDIGKLPDNNIAEALQRITGVSINTDFGVGDSVSIRGLSQNRVELNGRSTVGDDRDGISLQDFPSSFLKSVEVIKSPTADMIEGALGGTVRMNTIRPLELKGFTAAGSLDLEYADKTENIAPIASLSIGNLWETSTGASFGVIGSLSYQDRSIRQDEYFDRVRLYDEDVNGLTANTPSGNFAVREQHTVQQFVEDRERLAGNVSFQYEPASERGNIYLDLSMTERSGSQAGSSILDVGGSRVYDSTTSQDAYGQVNNYTLEGAFVIPKTFSDFRNTKSFSHALGGEWDFTDKLNVSAEASIASSESDAPDSELTLRPVNKTNWTAWVAGGGTDYDADRSAFDLRHTVDAVFSQNGDAIPSVVYSDPLALVASENLALRTYQHNDVQTTNDENAIRFDVDYKNPFGLDFVSSVKAGARLTTSDYEYNQSRYEAKDVYKNAFTDAGVPYSLWLDDIETLHPGSITTVSHANSFDQSGLSGELDLLEYRIFDGDLLSDPEATFDIIQSLLAGTNLATTGDLASNLTVQEGAFRDISEDTKAFYISANLEFDKVRATLGGRYVQTDLDSTVYLDGEKVSGNNDYSDFLPSLNVTYDVAEDWVVRFAAAKVMRRPNYDELSPAFDIDSSLVTATQGAIDLDPYRATQYDISVERYFGEGGLISGALFYKDVESFLSSETTCVANSSTVASQNVTEFSNVCLLDTAGVSSNDLVFSDDEAVVISSQAAGLTGIRTSKVTNGEKGKVKGFEIAVQQQLDFLPGILSNLGVNANYTYADSEQPNGNPLLDISKNTLNTQLYWENEKFQVRLAYNYRDEFLDTEQEKRVEQIGALALGSATDDETSSLYDATAGNNYRDSRGQLDFSTSYNVSENMTVAASVTNLTGEPSVFITELGSPWKYTEADRRFTVGVRAKY